MFSLRSLLSAVAFAAVSVAALANANRIWASLFATILMFMLFASIVAALYQANTERKAFWVGFAIYGWGSFFLMNSWLTNRVNLIPTTRLISDVGRLAAGNPTLMSGRVEAGSQIAHAIYVLVFAFSGGLLAHILAGKRKTEN